MRWCRCLWFNQAKHFQPILVKFTNQCPIYLGNLSSYRYLNPFQGPLSDVTTCQIGKF